MKLNEKSPLTKIANEIPPNRNDSLNLRGLPHEKSHSLHARPSKNLTPLRNKLNSTVLDAHHLGFNLPDDLSTAFSPSSALSHIQGKVSPRKRELRKKQLIAYHGWLK